MVGVSNPLMRENREEGWRFLWGFLAGLALACVTVLVLLLSVAALASLLPAMIRSIVLVALLTLLGLADLTNRTPHVWRQVPQRFARQLPPGRLGLVWAYDLGLLVTTQKTTSLLWVGLAGAVLAASPAALAATTALISLLFGLGVVIMTLTASGSALTMPVMPSMPARWLPTVRLASGAAALAIAAFETGRLL